MDALDRIAEARIAEAVSQGAFDDLPGAGRPLVLDDDDPYVAPELRTAYRLLKNAGYVPEEVRLRGEIHAVETLLLEARCEEERRELSGRLQLLIHRLGEDRAGSLALQESYYQRLAERISASKE